MIGSADTSQRGLVLTLSLGFPQLVNAGAQRLHRSIRLVLLVLFCGRFRPGRQLQLVAIGLEVDRPKLALTLTDG
jgi:hypothetical protein